MAKKNTTNANNRNPVAWMAATVSLCALVVSLYQTYLQRKQQYASVWPRLEVYSFNQIADSSYQCGFRVMNRGVGPAIIESVELQVNEKNTRQLGEFAGFLLDTRPNLAEVNNSINDLVSVGTFIPAGQEIDWLAFTAKVTDRYWLDPALQNARILIRYTSIYGEKWEVCLGCPDYPHHIKLN
ncbi:MAG: hypothetical protein JNL02_17760 [Saprospiraceae bacterium]|nr:hypothetical protein [Saprospiraceae bacterium]